MIDDHTLLTCCQFLPSSEQNSLRSNARKDGLGASETLVIYLVRVQDSARDSRRRDGDFTR